MGEEAARSWQQYFGFGVAFPGMNESARDHVDSYGSEVKAIALQFAFRACETGRFKNSVEECAKLESSGSLMQFVPKMGAIQPQLPNCLPQVQDMCSVQPGDVGPCLWPWSLDKCSIDQGP